MTSAQASTVAVILAAIAFFASLSTSSTISSAADATAFAILTTQTGKVPEVHPNDELRLRLVDGDTQLEPAKVKLLIDGAALPDVAPTIQDREMLFQLTRNDQNRGFWARVLGVALDRRKTVFVGLEVNGKSLKYRSPPIGIDESPQQKIDFVPAEPTTFSIVSNGGTIPDVNLKGTLKTRIDGDTPIEETKVQLRIDGELLNVTPRVLDGRELEFPLVRNDKNRLLWSRLLGAPFSADERPVPVSVEVGGKPLKYTEFRKSDEALEPMMDVVPYNGWLMTVGILCVVAAMAISVGFAARTSLIKDRVIPPMRASDCPYSLGKLQMLIWFCLILSSFVFIFAVTFDLNSITAESFILLGISASTALGAVAIDGNKDDSGLGRLRDFQSEIEKMGIRTSGQVEALFKARKKDGSKPAASIVPGAALPGAASPTIAEICAAYETKIVQISDFCTSGLLGDLVNDAQGPTIHRWQMLIWTIVLGLIYVWSVYMSLETPTFGANLLALMGISGGVYLGFKIPEKQR